MFSSRHIRLKTGGSCAITNTAVKVRNAISGLVKNSAKGRTHLLSTHGRNIEAGTASSISGGITKVWLKCCSICIVKDRRSAHSSTGPKVKIVTASVTMNQNQWRGVT